MGIMRHVTEMHAARPNDWTAQYLPIRTHSVRAKAAG